MQNRPKKLVATYDPPPPPPPPFAMLRFSTEVALEVSPEYSEQLIDFRVSMEERSFCNHLGEDAGNAPDIDRAGVALTTEQDLRSTVPQSHNL